MNQPSPTALKARVRRANETPAQREIRLEKVRQRARARRAAPPPLTAAATGIKVPAAQQQQQKPLLDPTTALPTTATTATATTITAIPTVQHDVPPLDPFPAFVPDPPAEVFEAVEHQQQRVHRPSEEPQATTDEGRAIRLLVERNRAKARRARESEEQHAARLFAQRQRAQARRAAESQREQESRLQIQRSQAHARRANESEEQHATRLLEQRTRAKARRARMTTSEYPSANSVCSDGGSSSSSTLQQANLDEFLPRGCDLDPCQVNSLTPFEQQENIHNHHHQQLHHHHQLQLQQQQEHQEHQEQHHSQHRFNEAAALAEQHQTRLQQCAQESFQYFTQQLFATYSQAQAVQAVQAVQAAQAAQEAQPTLRTLLGTGISLRSILGDRLPRP